MNVGETRIDQAYAAATPPVDTVTVASPGARMLMSPVGLTVATAVSDVLQLNASGRLSEL